jgi:hypothetical protein
VRSIAQAIACDIHRINNLRVLQYLEAALASTSRARRVVPALDRRGLRRIERSSPSARAPSAAATPHAADVCLVPQVFNASALDVDMAPYPRIRAITRPAWRPPRAPPDASRRE